MFGQSVESQLIVDPSEVVKAAEVSRVDAEGVFVALPGFVKLTLGLEDQAANVGQVVANGRP